MTLPDERYRAIQNTRMFLLELCNPAKTPRVPKSVRETANWCLRHYPTTFDMKSTANRVPDLFAEHIEDVTRMFIKYEQSKVEKDAT